VALADAAEYVPSAHGVHVEAPDPEYNPAAHEEHIDEEAEPVVVEYVPAEHEVHDVCAEEEDNFPAGHVVHAVEAVAAEYEPALHDVHAVAELRTAYVPTAHAVQLVAPVPAMYLPDAQLEQAVALDVEEYLPAAQEVQVEVPYLPDVQTTREVSGRTTISPSLNPAELSTTLVTCCARRNWGGALSPEVRSEARFLDPTTFPA